MVQQNQPPPTASVGATSWSLGAQPPAPPITARSSPRGPWDIVSMVPSIPPCPGGTYLGGNSGHTARLWPPTAAAVVLTMATPAPGRHSGRHSCRLGEGAAKLHWRVCEPVAASCCPTYPTRSVSELSGSWLQQHPRNSLPYPWIEPTLSPM